LHNADSKIFAKGASEQSDRGTRGGKRLLQVSEKVAHGEVFFRRRGEPQRERFD